jgi:hypothetical protein
LLANLPETETETNKIAGLVWVSSGWFNSLPLFGKLAVASTHLISLAYALPGFTNTSEKSPPDTLPDEECLPSLPAGVAPGGAWIERGKEHPSHAGDVDDVYDIG